MTQKGGKTGSLCTVIGYKDKYKDNITEGLNISVTTRNHTSLLPELCHKPQAVHQTPHSSDI